MFPKRPASDILPIIWKLPKVGMQLLELGRGEGAVGFIHVHFVKHIRPIGYKWIISEVVQLVGSIVVRTDSRTVNGIPINTIFLQAITLKYILWGMKCMWLKATCTMLEHAEVAQLVWARNPMFGSTHAVVVPSFGPYVNLRIESGEEKVMDQPYVMRVISIKSAAKFEILKKLLPFGSYPVRKVNP
jgi:hypothetical protein